MGKTQMVEFAVAYGKKGIRVHPLKTKDKTPLLTGWQHKATTDETQIREWWSKWPDANIGLACGQETGWAGIDLDGAEGELSWTKLISIIPDIPEDTLEQKTFKGRHLIFKNPPGIEIRNQQGFMPGIDIRGDGGYICGAPSVHPTGFIYTWPYGMNMEPAEMPQGLVDAILEKQGSKGGQVPVVAPEQPQAAQDQDMTETSKLKVDQARNYGPETLDRARAYLDTVPPAIQGQGGHDSLLWAARCMVVGFELSDADAYQLLQEWNLRCSPPWDMSTAADMKDFTRKITEARTLPFNKPSGWLLNEAPMPIVSDEVVRRTEEWVKNILENLDPQGAEMEKEMNQSAQQDFQPFPTHVFPPGYQKFIREAALAYRVDESVLGMPMLVTAGAAMGNAFRLHVKENFRIPPILWFGLIAASGQNKTAPVDMVTLPLKDVIPAAEIEITPTTFVHRQVLANTTVEALLSRLSHWPRGAMCNRDELAAWIKTFDVYKGGKGGDEQDWLEFWNGGVYIMDRKTNDEEVIIKAASISVLGGIQPQVVMELFTTARLVSGLLPRLLVSNPPKRKIRLTRDELSAKQVEMWSTTIKKLRLHPYASLNAVTGQLMPHILMMEPAADEAFYRHFNEIGESADETNEWVEMFASKAAPTIGRLAIPLHALRCIEEGRPITSDIDELTIENAAELTWWAYTEQLRVYGLACKRYQRKEMNETLELLWKHANDEGAGSTRDVYRQKNRNKEEVVEKIQRLVDAGMVEWTHENRYSYRILTER